MRFTCGRVTFLKYHIDRRTLMGRSDYLAMSRSWFGCQLFTMSFEKLLSDPLSVSVVFIASRRSTDVASAIQGGRLYVCPFVIHALYCLKMTGCKVTRFSWFYSPKISVFTRKLKRNEYLSGSISFVTLDGKGYGEVATSPLYVAISHKPTTDEVTMEC